MAAIEACAVPAQCFGHRDHLRLGWLYLRAAPYPVALRRMAQSIRRLAAHHGAQAKYHHTLTVVWLRLLASAVSSAPEGRTFESLLAENPELLDRAVVFRFYSAARLNSEAARWEFVLPDLLRLPEGGQMPWTGSG